MAFQQRVGGSRPFRPQFDSGIGRMPQQQGTRQPSNMSHMNYEPLRKRAGTDNRYYTDRPDLWRLLGKKRMNAGVDTYSEWCQSIYAQRRFGSIMLFVVWMLMSFILSWIPHWFMCAMFDYFSIKNTISTRNSAYGKESIENEKNYVFNHIYDYTPLLALPAIWQSVIIVFVYSLFLWIRSRHVFMTRKSFWYLFKNNNLMQICYLFFGLIGVSMCSCYLNCIGSDFSMLGVASNNKSLSHNFDYKRVSSTIHEYLTSEQITDESTFWYFHSMNEFYYYEASRILMINICVFSYVFGAVSQYFCKENRITLPYFQISRSDYVKQMIQNILRGCVFYCTIWSLLSIVFYLILDWFNLLTLYGFKFTSDQYLCLIMTQFRLTFLLEYIFLSGEFIFNRIFSESVQNMEHSPYILVPNNPRVDVTIYALNRTPQTTRNVEYFWYLSLMELLNLCENSVNGRLRIYGSEEIFDLITNIILADFCEFEEDLYNHLLRFQNSKMNIIFKYRELVPETKSVFAHYRALLFDAQILELLVIKSYHEDSRGIVHPKIEKILVTMLDTLSMLDVYLTSASFRNAFDKKGKRVVDIPPKIYALQVGISSSVVNIWRRFSNTDIRLPQSSCAKLSSLLQA